MAGVVGEINNNLLGLQQLALGRQQLEQSSAASENNRIASESLRKYYASEQAGAPDTEALSEAFLRSPELAGRMLQGAGITDKRKGQDAADYALKAYQSIDNPQEFVDLTANRINYLQKTGRDASHTIKALEAYQSGQKEEVRKGTKLLLSSLANQGFVDKDIYSQVVGVNLGGSNTGRSEILDDGTVIQSTPTGPVVYSASGKRLSGEEAANAVRAAQNYGAELQAQRAGGRAAAVGNVNLGLAPQIAGAVDTARANVELATQPAITSATDTAANQADAAAKEAAAQKKNARALAVYEQGIGSVRDALEGVNTGYISGKLPAVTEKQQTAEGALAAMAPVLKDLFREAGEGTFTKEDQQILMNMLPTRSDGPGARAAKIKNVDALVKVKLQGGSGQSGATPGINGNVGRFKIEVQD